MTSRPDSVSTGLTGMQAFVERMQVWRELPDAADYALYVDNAIIKFGTGGGFFRNHFAIFMQWSRQQRPDLVTETTVELAELAARQWNDLSPMMQSLVASPDDAGCWQQALDQAESIYETEYALFNFLGDTVLRDSTY